jgi:UDP-glucose 4-epimerase
MTVLVTGCAGFIGSHLVEELLKNKNINIIGVDNLYSGYQNNIDFLKLLDIDNRFTYYKLDIRDFELLENYLKNYNIDVVFHLAALVSVQESINNPMLSSAINIKGTQNILEFARLYNAKRIVFSSSAAVYGDELSLPKNELSVTKPISPYGLEKLVGEQLLELYSNLYGLESIVLRYFNVYGERQSATSDYSGVISIFDKRIKNNEAPIVYGDGTQYRDFIYVKDVVKANILSMQIKDTKFEIFCIGTGNKISINDIIIQIKNKYNANIKPIFKNKRDGDIYASICDNNKVKTKLGLLKFKIFSDKIKENN